MEELKKKAEEISAKITKDMGDIGASILGYNILVDGEQFIPQPVQGDSTCYTVYDAVKRMLVENGIDESRIYIDTGIID